MPVCCAELSGPEAKARSRAVVAIPVIFMMIMWGLLGEVSSFGSLKVELQRELELSRIARRQRISEAAHVRGSRSIDVIRIKFQRRRLGTDRAKLSKQEVRVVEDVEEFRSEFEMHLLANRKPLDQ